MSDGARAQRRRAPHIHEGGARRDHTVAAAPGHPRLRGPRPVGRARRTGGGRRARDAAARGLGAVLRLARGSAPPGRRLEPAGAGAQRVHARARGRDRTDDGLRDRPAQPAAAGRRLPSGPADRLRRSRHVDRALPRGRLAALPLRRPHRRGRRPRAGGRRAAAGDPPAHGPEPAGPGGARASRPGGAHRRPARAGGRPAAADRGRPRRRRAGRLPGPGPDRAGDRQPRGAGRTCRSHPAPAPSRRRG